MEERTYKAAEYIQELFKCGAIPASANRAQLALEFLKDVDVMEKNTLKEKNLTKKE